MRLENMIQNKGISHILRSSTKKLFSLVKISKRKLSEIEKYEKIPYNRSVFITISQQTIQNHTTFTSSGPKVLFLRFSTKRLMVRWVRCNPKPTPNLFDEFCIAKASEAAAQF